MTRHRPWSKSELDHLDTHGPEHTAAGMTKFINRSPSAIGAMARIRGVLLRGVIVRGPWEARELHGLHVLGYIGLTAVQIKVFFYWRSLSDIMATAKAHGIKLASGVPQKRVTLDNQMKIESLAGTLSLDALKLPFSRIAEAI